MIDAAWSGLVDDAAVFPPGDAPLPDAVAAFTARRTEWYADLVGSLVLPDTALGEAGEALDVSVVLTGGAGAIPGALHVAGRHGHTVRGLEVALRDPDDPAGNARRVVAALDAAREEGLLTEDTEVFVELPAALGGHGWAAAADEVAAAELRLKFRTGGLDAGAHPSADVLAGWIDGALDRETPFKCTAGLHHALRHTTAEGWEQHGFLNVLAATLAAFDGAGRAEVVELLEAREATGPQDALADGGVPRARRWFTSFGSCSVTEPLQDLITLGHLETR